MKLSFVNISIYIFCSFFFWLFSFVLAQTWSTDINPENECAWFKEESIERYDQCIYEFCLIDCREIQDDFDYCECKCNWWVTLNTDIPFIGRCIEKNPSATPDNPTAWNAFVFLLSWLMQVVLSAVIIIWFLAILIWWFMIASAWVKSDLMWKGKDLIIKVIAWLILVGLSGVILRLINPSFFKTDTTSMLDTHDVYVLVHEVIYDERV